MDTITEQTAALRMLAKHLNLLADQVESGHAKYEEGSFNYEINRDHDEVPSGAMMRSRLMPGGDVHLTANLKFRTGIK